MQNIPYNPLKHSDTTKYRVKEGTVYEHVLSALKNSKSTDPLINIGILLHDIAKAITYKDRSNEGKSKFTYYGHESSAPQLINKIADRLKLSNEHKEAINFAAKNHMLLHHPERLSRNKIVQIVHSPYWNILKGVGYGDATARGFIADTKKYENDIEYLERIAKETSAGGGAEGLKKRLKGLINGNLLISWIPDLNIPDNRPLIGQILSKVQEWLVNSGRFDLKQDEIKNLALKFYNELLK